MELSLNWTCTNAKCKSKKKPRGKKKTSATLNEERMPYAEWMLSSPVFPLVVERLEVPDDVSDPSLASASGRTPASAIALGSSPSVIAVDDDSPGSKPQKDKDTSATKIVYNPRQIPPPVEEGSQEESKLLADLPSFVKVLRDAAFDVAPKGCDYCEEPSPVDVAPVRLPAKIFLLHLNWHVPKPTKKALTYLMRYVVEDMFSLTQLFQVPPGQQPPADAQITGIITYKGHHYTALMRHQGGNSWYFANDKTVRQVASNWRQLVDWLLANNWIPTFFVCRVFSGYDQTHTPEASPRPVIRTRDVSPVAKPSRPPTTRASRASANNNDDDPKQPRIDEAFRSARSNNASVEVVLEGLIEEVQEICQRNSREQIRSALIYKNKDKGSAIQLLLNNPDWTMPQGLPEGSDFFSEALQERIVAPSARRTARQQATFESEPSRAGSPPPKAKGSLSNVRALVFLGSGREHDIKARLKSAGAVVARTQVNQSISIKDSKQQKTFLVTSLSYVKSQIEANQLPVWVQTYLKTDRPIVSDSAFDHEGLTMELLAKHNGDERLIRRAYQAKGRMALSIAVGTKRPREGDDVEVIDD